jgi:hypothetical protein
MEKPMKILKSLLVVTGLALVPLSAAQAHDSFSFGINIGGGYPAPVVRHYGPPVVYYGGPAYYAAPQPYYYAPRASFRYYDNDRHHHRHHGWKRDRDWDRGDRHGHGHRGHRGRD